MKFAVYLELCSEKFGFLVPRLSSDAVEPTP